MGNFVAEEPVEIVVVAEESVEIVVVAEEPVEIVAEEIRTEFVVFVVLFMDFAYLAGHFKLYFISPFYH